MSKGMEVGKNRPGVTSKGFSVVPTQDSEREGGDQAGRPWGFYIPDSPVLEMAPGGFQSQLDQGTTFARMTEPGNLFTLLALPCIS